VLDRDATGKVAKGAVGEVAESWMLLAVDRESDEARRNELERTVRHVLEDVRQAVEDWPKMRTKALVVAAELEGAPPEGIDADETALAIRFLRWMADNHFTFLGYRDYTLRQTEAGEVIEPVTGTGLGLLRSDPPLGKAAGGAERRGVGQGPRGQHPRADQGQLALDRAPRWPTSTTSGSRPTTRTATVVGERRFLGLYASTAYTESVLRMPARRREGAGVLDRSGVAHDSHTGKDLLGVLESYPRDELIQASVEQLYETTMAVTQLQERRRTKLFIREDDFGRFVSCLVYIPRDRYNTAVRMKMADLLKGTFGGESVEFSARVSESALSRLQFVVRVERGKRIRRLDRAEQDLLEQRLVEVSRTWTDRLGDALRAEHGEEEGDRLLDRFGRAFPTAYEETFTVRQGVADLAHLDRLGEGTGTSVALYRPSDAPDTIRRFKLFRVDPLSLTDVLPIFTHMGVEVVDENPFEISRADGVRLHVYDFGLRVPDAAIWEECTHDQLRHLFEGAVSAVWDGRAESDGFNRLVLAAQLTWPRPAGAAPAVRDLGLQPPGRGRAPALRPGRARRPALVRPARGLPHRGARPGQGADGQERRHRAGRLQGRLLPKPPDPAVDREAWLAEGVACLPHVHLGLLDLTDNRSAGKRSCRRPAWCATTATTPTWSSPPTRARPPSPTSPTASRRVVRLLARRRLRLRRLGRLRPQGHGHHRPRRVGVGQAPLPRDGPTPRARTSPSSASATCRRRVRQRHAAVRAHPPGGRVRPPPHLHRPRTRTRPRSFTERARLFDLPRSSWDDYDRR
jgi:NAD-specific glutamate dehydrogenase